jgi:hypothetical protein
VLSRLRPRKQRGCRVHAAPGPLQQHEHGMGVAPSEERTMWHRPGYWCRGDRRGGPGCAWSRSRPALPSPVGNSLQKSHIHAAVTSLGSGASGDTVAKALPVVPRGQEL